MRLRRPLPMIAPSLVALALGACGASARTDKGTTAGSRTATPTAVTSATTGAAPATPCGAGAAETLARTAGLVATRIYAGELSGEETRSDQRQVEGFNPLLSALAGGQRGAARAAVTSLVFSHTHVVRLRVTQGSTVVADIGGPYILAPVGGTLRFHGRTVGHYVLSVQDDLGYVKLVTRFIGAPLVLRTGARTLPVEGVLSPGPASIPDHGPVTYRNVAYEAFSFDGRSFPDGPLRISLLVPLPPSLPAGSCAAIRTAEVGKVSQRISRRFALSPSTLPTFVRLAGTLTGARLYVRSGSHQLAGSSSPGPSRIPSSGTITYGRARYRVISFMAPTSVGPVRVYVLVR